MTTLPLAWCPNMWATASAAWLLPFARSSGEVSNESAEAFPHEGHSAVGAESLAFA